MSTSTDRPDPRHPLTALAETRQEPRVASAGDVATVTRILVDAFADDPMWGAWAFPDPATRRSRQSGVFRLLVEGALRYPWLWLIADAAAAVWIPPGGTELSEEQEEQLSRLIASLDDPAPDRLRRGLDLFERVRPCRAHFYLSLLGTDPAQAGRGQGQRLLSATLRRIDAENGAAYLEAADELVPFYRHFGFAVMQTFDLPDGPTVNGMWRAARR